MLIRGNMDGVQGKAIFAGSGAIPAALLSTLRLGGLLLLTCP